MHLLVDGNNLMWKSILGRGGSGEQASDGRSTGAAVAFVRELVSGLERHKPTHCAVVFDGPGPGFRRLLRGTYKASREHAMEPEAAAQIPMMRAAVEHLGLSRIDSSPYEADDVLVSLARLAEEADADAVLLSDDKDLGQALSRRVRQQRHVDRRGGRPAPLLDAVSVRQRWGVPTHLLADMQALCGDAGDEVAGIAGVGPVAARRLLESRGSLEGVAAHADVDGGKRWVRVASEMVEVVSHHSAVRLLADVTTPELQPVPRDWPRLAAHWYASVDAHATAKALGRRHGIRVASSVGLISESRPSLFGARR